MIFSQSNRYLSLSDNFRVVKSHRFYIEYSIPCNFGLFTRSVKSKAGLASALNLNLHEYANSHLHFLEIVSSTGWSQKQEFLDLCAKFLFSRINNQSNELLLKGDVFGTYLSKMRFSRQQVLLSVKPYIDTTLFQKILLEGPEKSAEIGLLSELYIGCHVLNFKEVLTYISLIKASSFNKNNILSHHCKQQDPDGAMVLVNKKIIGVDIKTGQLQNENNSRINHFYADKDSLVQNINYLDLVRYKDSKIELVNYWESQIRSLPQTKIKLEILDQMSRLKQLYLTDPIINNNQITQLLIQMHLNIENTGIRFYPNFLVITDISQQPELTVNLPEISPKVLKEIFWPEIFTNKQTRQIAALQLVKNVDVQRQRKYLDVINKMYPSKNKHLDAIEKVIHDE